MYSAFYRRTFAIATFLIVSYLLLEVLRPLAGPLGWAAVLAFLLTPVQVRLIGGPVHWMRENSTVSADQVQSWLTDGIQSLLKSAATASGTFALGVLGSLVGFFMTIFLLFFLLRDGRMMLERLARLVPMEPDRRKELLSYLADVTRAVVFGSVATALIQGALAGVGFAIVGLPSPVVFAVLATIAAFLPAGSAIVLVPAVLYLMVGGRWGAAIFLAVWSAGVGVADNFLRPFL